MKQIVTFPADFSALCADILAAHEAEIDSEAIIGKYPAIQMIAMENLEVDYPSMVTALKDEPIVIDSISRRFVVEHMRPAYAVLSCDQILIPLKNAEKCELNIFEVPAGEELVNSSFPEGVTPTHGHYQVSTVQETLGITGPIFIKRGTAWSIDTNNGEIPAHFLMLSSIEDNSAYFA